MNYADLEWRWAVVLGTALREGVLEGVCSGPRAPEDLARELGLDGRAVFTVLSALEELGVVRERSGEFELREEHRGPLLDPRHERYAGGRVVHRFELILKWAELPRILRTGEPAEDRTVPEFEGTQTMARAMRAGSKESAEEITALLLPRLPEGAEVLDVGGGSGANAESFARAGARVTVLDRPEVLAVNGEFFSAAGVETVAGEVDAGLPEGPFDCVYFGNTSHMYGPDWNRRVFRRMYGSLRSGGLLAVREFVRGAVPPEAGGEAALFAVNMLVLTRSGGTYTFEEYRSWLEEAGFRDAELVPVEGRTTSLVLARKP
ncbi:Methyltransferase domain [Rubrobacter radiotolerans]|uniref:Class I SAM-dependent methyltransferase n=1 Tax=Rubrobacter radiotolerans TaxID=42256 RepID=A0A023X1G6_RUBRA|nr:class I SAM-dependent methyltransferase [Rubrobacter radiotolerans]AHY46317.1 Methyltransferase domain [Rubrobacter radiotolerans]MDX5893724.1 class I SAM-dependent methyltransferase [Rubrobacter radiotolerans]SMC04361.1 Ubiquinone/menaquinone biosynthesis C-methylase UbiE [Rubrobacter radiotolerans DSM 5868]